MIKEADSDVTRATCNVEDTLGFGSGRTTRGVGVSGRGGRQGLPNTRVDGAHEAVFPETVDIEGHQVVHGIIILSHGREYRADCKLRHC